jgi:hypothetical protein
MRKKKRREQGYRGWPITHLRHSAQEISPRFLFISISRECIPSCRTPAGVSRFTLRRSEWGLERSTGIVAGLKIKGSFLKGHYLKELSFNRDLVAWELLVLMRGLRSLNYPKLGNSETLLRYISVIEFTRPAIQ